MIRGKGIGIYAGTFDPVHNGHVTFALAAARVCGLQKVVFLPEREPRGKSGVSDFDHRVQMIRLAIKDYPHLTVERLEAPRFSVKYTLPELQAMFEDTRLTLLIGSDNALAMNPDTWPDVEKLYASADIAVGMREGHEGLHLEPLAKQANIVLVYTNFAGAAATKVRAGQRDVVHPLVHEYIQRNGLYQPTP